MGMMFEERSRGKIYIIKVRPIAYPFLFDRLSIIVEIRDENRKIIEVWHYHVRHSDGKIIHRDRKYPME